MWGENGRKLAELQQRFSLVSAPWLIAKKIAAKETKSLRRKSLKINEKNFE
jgi:hypothetical protein